MRVGIVYNEPERTAPEEHWLMRSAPEVATRTPEFLDSSEVGVLQETQLIERFLRDAGYETELFAANDAYELASFLQRARPDVIFNCCESFSGNAALEMSVAAVYELFGIAYTGSPALTLGMSLDKSIAKALFQAHGVPTAPWAALEPGAAHRALTHLTFPLIVKPMREDASIGIDEHAVVHNEPALWDRIGFVWEQLRQPALVEEFIDGRELNLALLASDDGFVPLPISEIVFQGPAWNHSPAMLTYEAKWFVESEAYRTSLPNCPADLPVAVAEQVRATALKAARALGLRDYGRVDFRLRRGDNAVFVLEVNPNPDITADSGFVRAAAVSGRSHGQVVCDILQAAIRRCRQQSVATGAP